MFKFRSHMIVMLNCKLSANLRVRNSINNKLFYLKPLADVYVTFYIVSYGIVRKKNDFTLGNHSLFTLKTHVYLLTTNV